MALSGVIRQSWEKTSRALSSPFFTADVARLASGGYTVLEINDGGCSTLPEQMDPRDFYRVLLD